MYSGVFITDKSSFTKRTLLFSVFYFLNFFNNLCKILYKWFKMVYNRLIKQGEEQIMSREVIDAYIGSLICLRSKLHGDTERQADINNILSWLYDKKYGTV